MACRVRLWNPEWQSSAIGAKELRRNDVHGRNDIYFEIAYKGTSSADATEVGAAANSVLDGTTTPVSLYVVSASASDTDGAAGHVRKVRIIGVSVASANDFISGLEDPVYSVEEVNMNGTTNVRSTRYYLRVIHMYASDWGSGDGDAAGNITCEYPENTALLTIAAGANESNGSVIYGASGHFGRWSHCTLCAADVAFNNT